VEWASQYYSQSKSSTLPAKQLHQKDERALIGSLHNRKQVRAIRIPHYAHTLIIFLLRNSESEFVPSTFENYHHHHQQQQQQQQQKQHPPSSLHSSSAGSQNSTGFTHQALLILRSAKK